jgi:hypothetical protein
VRNVTATREPLYCSWSSVLEENFAASPPLRRNYLYAL